jgi:hypothetical protein
MSFSYCVLEIVMSAKTVGIKLGRGLGFVAATAWKGTVVVAEGAGQLGEGFLEGAEAGWEDRCAAMDAARAARKAANAAKVAALLATMEAERSAPLPVTA